MVHPGRVVLGKYRVERILGTGGMGVVALVHHLQLDEPMAMKFLQPRATIEQPGVVHRFLREAQAAVKLKGEHICRIFDVGRLESGAPYMVMEYLQGLDLGDFLRQYGAQPMVVVVDIMRQACAALAEAHAMGIVHRDVKPTNFFLTQRQNGTPLVKLLDFGISKASAHDDLELTAAQTMLGTPAYMSPEQLRSSKAVDARTDIWALGVVLYELASGRRPFTGDTFSALCLKIALEPPPPLPVPVPPAFEAVVMRCLQKEPGDRFQTVTELAHALEPFHQAAGSPLMRLGQPVPGGLEVRALPANLASPGSDNDKAHAISTTLSSGTGHIPVSRVSAPRTPIWLLAALSLVLVGVAVSVFFVASDRPLPDDRARVREPSGAAVPVQERDAAATILASPDAGPPSDAFAGTEPDITDEPVIDLGVIEPDRAAEVVQPRDVERDGKARGQPDSASKSAPDPVKPSKRRKNNKPELLGTGDTLPWK